MWTGRTTRCPQRPDPKETAQTMTANQRRPGFRLPWSSELDEPGAESESGSPASEGSEPVSPAPPAGAAAPRPEKPAAPSPAAAGQGAANPEADALKDAAPTLATAPAAPAPADEAAGTETDPTPAAATSATPATGDGGDDFMRDLVSAMRRVAEEARDAGISDLRARADEQVSQVETDAARRGEDLRARAEVDVGGIGEWAKAEAERIKQEAEQRVVARRAQLEQQLAADAQRTETETKALRDRVDAYERELAAYHGQLGEINDPAAFAAAAKRMPKAPELGAGSTVAPGATAAPPAEAKEPGPAAPDDDAPVEPTTAGSNGVPVPTDAGPIHPAEEEVLAARLAQLDATLPATEAAGAGGAAGAPAATEAATTEVIVKGLGSFGAITGFRQALSAVDGIEGVALSLGQTGEFVFRATHAAGFDVRDAIATLEGDAARIEDRPEGGLRITLDRAR
jgi:hypothetical protein